MANNEYKRWCVYIHKNKLNGKMYVGMTSQKPENRWQKGAGYHREYAFYGAVQKYGWDGFEHIIDSDGLSQKEAKSRERELIAQYHTNEKRYGYNLTNGGEGELCEQCIPVCQFSLEGDFIKEYPSITLAADAVNGHKGHIIDVCKGKYATAYDFCWAYSRDCNDMDELKKYFQMRVKEKIESGRGRNGNGNSDCNKPVYQLDEDGNIISAFKSASSASKAFGLCNASAISNACRTHHRSARWYWLYVDDYEKIKESGEPFHISKPAYKPVLQFDLEGNFIKEYKNCPDAARVIGCSSASINQVCLGNRKTCKGFIWKYKKSCKQNDDGTFSLLNKG